MSVKRLRESRTVQRAELWTIEVPPARGAGGQHNEIRQFTDAILTASPLSPARRD